MKRTITRLFDTHPQALAVIDALEAAGVPHEDISIIANNADNWHHGHEHPEGERGRSVDLRMSEGEKKGAMYGGAVGGTAGLLAALGMIAIPGTGVVLAAGWLAAAATGALTGTVAGGLIGLLKGAGESDEDAQVYAEAVRRGGSIVSVRADHDDRDRIAQILDSNLGVAADVRGADYRSGGWTGFDQTAAEGEGARYDPDLEPGRGEGRSFVSRDAAPTGGMSQDDTDAARPAADWMAPGQSPRR